MAGPSSSAIDPHLSRTAGGRQGRGVRGRKAMDAALQLPYAWQTMSRADMPVAVAIVLSCMACAVALPPTIAAEPVTAPKAKREAEAKKAQTDAVAAYDEALAAFKAILAKRRTQIEAKAELPELPGQAVYLARIQVISRYKDLTDVMPSRIGRPNKFGVPPDHLDADIEPLVDEYAALFRVMQAPPSFAQASDTPFEDIVTLGIAIARAQGLDDASARVAGRLSLALFYAETGGFQNIGNARSNKYKGSLQTDVAEDRRGRAKWQAIKARIAKLDPAVAARDAREEARAAGIDQRYNHWTAVRNGLANAAGELFPQIPQIVTMLPDEMDQMKFFELIQIVPSPTRAALKSGDILSYKVSEPRIMGYLRNNSMFTFGKANRAKSTATYREILDAMWLFEPKFQQAATKFREIESKR
jgi:hypothetical protein